MSDFNTKFGGKWVQAANLIRKTPGRVEIYVEGQGDIPFWYRVFKKFAPKLKVKIFPYTTVEKEDGLQNKTGKPSVLLHKDSVDPYKLLCVDSDYDYLLPEQNDNAKAINTSPYIFQTYTYSIENYKCFAASLDYICVEASYNSEVHFNFIDFLENYSKSIYDLFLYLLYSTKRSISNLTEKEFRQCVCLNEQISINNETEIETIFKDIKEKCNKIIEEIKKDNHGIEEEIGKLQNELQAKGITPNTTYLFIKGHTLFDCVVKNLVKKVVYELKTNKIKEIKEIQRDNPSPQTQQETIERIKEITKQPNYDLLLNINKDFDECNLMKKIQTDIQQYLLISKIA